MKHWVYGGGGLVLGLIIAAVVYYKVSIEQGVHALSGILSDNMSFYQMIESERPDAVKAAIQISFNSLYCQAKYLDGLPLISTSYSEGLLLRADEFRRSTLHTYPDNVPLTQKELACNFL